MLLVIIFGAGDGVAGRGFFLSMPYMLACIRPCPPEARKGVFGSAPKLEKTSLFFHPLSTLHLLPRASIVAQLSFFLN